MKIEKRKVSCSKPFSAAVKSAIAASFGIAAAFTLNACDDSTSASSEQGGDTVTEPESSAQVEPGSSAATEGAATSSQAESKQSSSSKVVDIPLSHEPLSSEAVEALSAAAESSSSEAAAVSVADNPASSAAAPSSSEAAPASSDATPASSTSPSSSSVGSWGQGTSSVEPCSEDDPFCIQVHMCENQYGCMVGSMVTTFERDDITG